MWVGRGKAGTDARALTTASARQEVRSEGVRVPVRGLAVSTGDHGPMSSRSFASDLRGLGSRAVAAVRAAPAWLGGILTGVQGLALSYLAVLGPSLAVAASSPAEGVGAAEWGGATSVATAIWLLGLGVPADVGGAVVGLIPLGLTVLYVAILAALARRFAARVWGSWVLAVVTYAAGVGVTAATVSVAEHPADVATATVVAVVVAVLGVTIGIWRAHGVDLSWLTSLPDWVRAGLRRGAGAMGIMVMLAAVAGVVWAVAGRHAISEAATALELDVVSAGVLAIAQLSYVPTLIIWMLSWLSGQGFAVGDGTAYAPDALNVDALPMLPVLGALPSAAGGLLVWAPILLIAAAIAARLAVRRPSLSWRHDAAADAVAAGLVCVGTAVAFGASTGSAGPGRLAIVGPDVVGAAVTVTVLTILGLAVGGLTLRVAMVITARRREERAPSDRQASTAW